MERAVIITGAEYVRKHLNAPTEGLSDEELAQKAVEAFRKADILGQPVRHRNGNTYYFNADGIYSVDKGSKMFQDCFLCNGEFDQGSLWAATPLWKKAAATFTVGSSLEDCTKVFLNTQLLQRIWYDSFIHRFVGRIETPSFEREPDNENKNTFDRIRVCVSLTQSMFNSREEMKAAIIEHRKEIAQMVLDKIEENRTFQRFGVPITVIKPTDVTLRRSGILEYIFEPKVRTLDVPEHQDSFESVLAQAKARVTSCLDESRATLQR